MSCWPAIETCLHSAWITLGYPFAEAPNEPKFVGSVSRLNVWQRALTFQVDIPSLVDSCQGAQEIFDGLVVRWTGYTRLSGKVELMVPSVCGAQTCARLSIDAAHRCDRHDKTSPVATYCPGDIFVTTPLKEVNVTWSPPTFGDDGRVDEVEHNLRPGQVLTWGDYNVIYAARDNATNVGVCQFKIYVTKEFCPDLPEPINGLQACDRWGPDLRYKACSVHCQNGFDFPLAPPLFYSCGEDGQWRPRAGDVHAFKYPQCSPMHTATRMVKMTVDYPTTAGCNEAGRTTLADKLLGRIAALNKQWQLCANTVGDEGVCPELNITIVCVTRSSRGPSFMVRARRQANDQQFYSAMVAFPANRFVYER